MKLVRVLSSTALVCALISSSVASAQRFGRTTRSNQPNTTTRNNSETITLNGRAASALFNLLGTFEANSQNERTANVITCQDLGSVAPEDNAFTCTIKVKNQALELDETFYNLVKSFFGSEDNSETVYSIDPDTYSAVLNGTQTYSLQEALVGSPNAYSIYNVSCKNTVCTGTR